MPCYGSVIAMAKAWNHLSQEDFLAKVYKVHGNNVIVLGEYIDSKTRVRYKCSKCGHEWEAIPASIYRHGCPKCARLVANAKESLTNQEFLHRVEVAWGHKVSVLDSYTGSKNHVTCRCNICGNVWKVKPNNLTYLRRGCPKCGTANMARKQALTDEQFREKVRQSNCGEVEILGKYVSAKRHIKVRCLKCGHVWSPAADSLMQGFGCPACTSSKGENVVREYLQAHEVRFEEQYKIDGCRNIRPLPFDFAVFDDAGNLEMLIEYDGPQHFESKYCISPDKHKREEMFESQKMRDGIKDAYCREHGIPLVRIPYVDGQMKDFRERLMRRIDDLVRL